MKKLIFRNFISDIASFFLIGAITLTLIVWVIQAVNYLDFVSEDGHSFKVYFFYSLLNFPKIFSKLIIFILFISIFYVITKYEENNEILIFWTNGIKKVDLINNLIKFSFLIIIFQIILNLFIVPSSQNLARSYIRESNIDFFPSLLKSKHFNDTVSNLTIFIEEKKNNGEFKNIFVKDSFENNKAQIITAKKGKIIKKNNIFFLYLENGKIINLEKKNSTSFKFDKSELNLSKYTSKTIKSPKIQELNSIDLLKCSHSFLFFNEGFTIKDFVCDLNSINPVLQEIYKRIISPFYIMIVVLISGCLIIKSKDDVNYFKYKFILFILGIFTVILSEISIQYTSYFDLINFLYLSIPFILSFILYLILNIKVKVG